MCACRDGETGEEASESGPKGLLHLSSKQVRKQEAESDLLSPVYTDTSGNHLIFHLFVSSKQPLY